MENAMKMATIQKVRIPLLLALACGEIAAIFILRGQPGFRVFLAVSLAVLLLVPPLLWIQEIWQRNVSYFVFVFFALGVALFIAELVVGRGLSQAPWNLLFVSFLIIGLTWRDRRHSKDFSEEQYRIRKAEDIRFFWVCTNLAGVVSCFIFLAHYPGGKWENVPLPIAFLFLCGTVYCLFIKRIDIGSSSGPGRDEFGSGGRA
jgi:hypothetical protein